MKRMIIICALSLMLVLLVSSMQAGPVVAQNAPTAPILGMTDRTVLPIAEPKYAPITEPDARNTKAPPRFEVKAPAGAPNVIVVLVDDLGFAGPVRSAGM